MSKFYVKNKKGDFIPIELSSIIKEDLQDRLVIVRVGTDDHPVNKSDLHETVRSFEEANVINKVRNVSVIITPYQIEVGLEDKANLTEKTIYLQIKSGSDISMLEEQIKEMYRKAKNKNYNIHILPTPLKVKDYQHVRDVLKRCQIRRERRNKVR